MLLKFNHENLKDVNVTEDEFILTIRKKTSRKQRQKDDRVFSFLYDDGSYWNYAPRGPNNSEYRRILE